MAKVNVFPEVFGQEPVKKALHQAFDRNRMPHALLFHGPKGTGKFSTALALSKLVLCEKKTGCGVCSDCKMVNSLSHPDLSITIPLPSLGEPPDRKKEEARLAAFNGFLEAKKENLYHPVWKENKDLITVADLQTLQNRLSRKPLQADWRAAILVDADRMQLPQAGNKLLKTLEEPHPNTLIILIAERPRNLLPTIVSRTQRFFFPHLPATFLAEFAGKTFDLSKEEALQSARLAAGSVANLYFLRAAEEMEKRARAWEVLQLAVSGNDALLFKSLKRVAETRQKDEVLSFLSWLELLIWEFFCFSQLKEPQRVTSEDLKTGFEKLSRSSQLPFPFLSALEEINKTRQDLERNVSFRLALFWLFIRILKGARPALGSY